MICHAFPPTGGAGVQRNAKLATYLPDYGWQPIVWSAPPHPNLPRDETLATELPKSLDHRTGPNIFPDRWPESAAHKIDTLLQAIRVQTTTREAITWRTRSALSTLNRILIPDETLLWAIASLNKLRTIIIRERIDIIHSSLGPPSTHLLAMLLKRITHRPWISDWRDLWTDDHWYPYRDGPAWRRNLDRKIETRLLTESDAVVSVSSAQCRILASRIPENQENCFTITNGYDPSDFAQIDRSQNGVSRRGTPDRFVLAHVGRFSAERVRPEMLEGIARFAATVNTNPENPRFVLKIVGDISSGAIKLIRKFDLPMEMTGYLPHKQAVREMVSASALLLQYPDGHNADTAISGKLFEYFAANVPILAVMPKSSETRRLVESCNAGIGVEVDADAVYNAVSELWHSWEAGMPIPGCPPHHAEQYTRQAVAKQFASILTALAEGRLHASRTTKHHTAQHRQPSIPLSTTQKTTPAGV